MECSHTICRDKTSKREPCKACGPSDLVTGYIWGECMVTEGRNILKNRPALERWGIAVREGPSPRPGGQNAFPLECTPSQSLSGTVNGAATFEAVSHAEVDRYLDSFQSRPRRKAPLDQRLRRRDIQELAAGRAEDGDS